jgi:hypothetical protein
MQHTIQERPKEGAMRKFSPQQLSWSLQRRIAVWSDQLREIALLGAGKLDYLTDAREEVRPDRYRPAEPRADDLLRRRMLAMGLDPDELAVTDPALFRHLQERCASCQNPQDCASELTRASTSRVWPDRDDWLDYCENVQALEMLVALRSRSKAAASVQMGRSG